MAYLFSSAKGRLRLKRFLPAVLFFLFSCAVQAPPGGGPIDRTPPEIVYSYPPPDSTGVKKLDRIRIRFSERMNEGSSGGNIFFSPLLEYEQEWESSDELHIILKDTLEASQTYVLVLGSEIKDLRAGNNLKQSFQLAFSSGDVIDRGRIAGRVFGVSRSKAATLLAYRVPSDTPGVDLQKRAAYISQSGDDGSYLLNYLRPDKYRVFALVDQNNNGMIDAQNERVGLPLRDVMLDSAALAYQGLNFRFTSFDTTAPELINARAVGNRRVDMRFTEKVVLPSGKQVFLFDSLSNEQIDILAFSPGSEEENNVELFTPALDVDRVYGLNVSSVRDSSGNVLEQAGQFFSVRGETRLDSFQLKTFTPRDSSWNEHPLTKLYFEFTRPVDSTVFRKAFGLYSKEGDTLQTITERPGAYEFSVRPERQFVLDKEYYFTLSWNLLTDVWGNALGDTVTQTRFKIHNGDEYGSISGTVSGIDTTSYPVYITFSSLGRGARSYRTQTANNSSFTIENIPDGQYTWSAFWDQDSNAVFSHGSLNPFRFSEPFAVSADTLTVRKRWETSGVQIVRP